MAQVPVNQSIVFPSASPRRLYLHPPCFTVLFHCCFRRSTMCTDWYEFGKRQRIWQIFKYSRQQGRREEQRPDSEAILTRPKKLEDSFWTFPESTENELIKQVRQTWESYLHHAVRDQTIFCGIMKHIWILPVFFALVCFTGEKVGYCWSWRLPVLCFMVTWTSCSGVLGLY